MKRFLAVLLLAAAAVWPQTEPSPKVFEQIDEIMVELSQMTGMKAPAKVQSATITKAGLKQFLEERIKEAIKPEEVRAEELTLKKLGFAPPEFDLRKVTIDLLTEQAAAFYDYRKKKLFLLDSTSSMMERTVLVHELAHALADAHYNLEKYILKGKSDDAALARQAVMEGQATWLMAESMARKLGQSLLKSPEMLEFMDRSTQSSGGAFPVFDQVPLYLREALLFPYTKGLRFQNAVVEKMGQEGFSEVFRRPPASTQQIIHPEKYFERVQPVTPPLPKESLPREYKELAAGSLGEFDHQILLKQYASEKEAAAIAPLWKGGSYKLVESKKQDRVILFYASEWDTPETAREFFRLYRKALEGKWKKMEVAEETEGLLRGVGDDGGFRVRLEGTRVTSVEGLP
jgi:hypothetical protein